MTTTTDRTDTISRPADVGTTDSGAPTTAHPADRPQFLAARARLAPCSPGSPRPPPSGTVNA
ncbi:hypothetical protein M3A78_004845 [Micrococcus luteus]|nr:hypothetical protein [Micrococcus luteus]